MRKESFVLSEVAPRDRDEKGPKRAAITGAAFAAAGFLLGRLEILGVRPPLAVALAAALPMSGNGVLAIAGAALSCLGLTRAAFNLRWFCCVLVVCGGRLIFIGKEGKTRLFEPFLAFSVMLSTGLAELLGGYAGGGRGILMAAELAAAVPLVLLLRRLYEEFSGGATFSSMKNALRIAAVIVGALILISAARLSFLGISLGRVIAGVLVLMAALGKEAAAAAATGCVAGFLLSLPAGGEPVFALSLTLGGIAASVVKHKKLSVAAVYAAVYLASAGLFLRNGLIVIAAEAVISAAVCLLMPPLPPIKYLEIAKRLFGLRPRGTQDIDYLKNRIEKSSRIVEDMGKEGQSLQKPYPSVRGLESVFEAVSAKLCKNCKNSALCWIGDYSGTMSSLNDCSEAIRKDGSLSPERIGEPLASRCMRKKELCGAVTAAYTEKLEKNRIAWNGADHYRVFSGMLSELAAEADAAGRADRPLSQKIESYFKSLNISAVNVCAYIGKKGMLVVEAVLGGLSGLSEQRSGFLEFLEKQTGRSGFNVYLEGRREGYYCLVTEKERFEILLSCAGETKKGESVSGDTPKTFKTNFGKFVAVLSDGMGSGARAARQSSFAASYIEQLIRSGASAPTALYAVGGILSAESGSDYFATADILIIDLYTGDAELIKAGGAPTLILRNGEVIKIDGSALPLGIIASAPAERTRFKVYDGDILLMMSDGVLDSGSGTESIEKMYRLYRKSPLRMLAQQLVSGLKNRRGESAADDMTVIALGILKKQNICRGIRQ